MIYKCIEEEVDKELLDMAIRDYQTEKLCIINSIWINDGVKDSKGWPICWVFLNRIFHA